MKFLDKLSQKMELFTIRNLIKFNNCLRESNYGTMINATHRLPSEFYTKKDKVLSNQILKLLGEEYRILGYLR